MDGLSAGGRFAYSPDGAKIACCSEGGIEVRDAQSGEPLGEKGDIGHVLSVAYSPNGAFLASGGRDFTVRLWNGETLDEVAVLRGHTTYVRSVAFSGDGSELVSASDDGTMIRWNKTSFEMIGGPIAAHEAQVYSAVYSPDSQLIASGSEDGSVRVWDLKSISDVESSTSTLGRIRSLACSPNGREFASASSDAKVRIHAADSGIVLKTLDGHTDEVSAVAYSLRGDLLASGSDARVVIVWNTETGSAVRKFEGHTGAITSVISAPDGKHVFSASLDGTVRRWNLEAVDNIGEILFKDSVRSICLSPDGKILASGGRDGTIRLSNPDNGSKIGDLLTTRFSVQHLAFSPNGRFVASGIKSDYEPLIELWDANTGTSVMRFRGHRDLIFSVAISSDGDHLLSASKDNTVRQWDIKTGVVLRELVGHMQAVNSVVYSLDEKHIISGSDDGTIRIWTSDMMQKSYVEEIGKELSSLPLADGWIKSETGDLLLWVPPEYRDGIREMCEVCIPADAPNAPVRLDWSKLVKGEEWTCIFRENSLGLPASLRQEEVESELFEVPKSYSRGELRYHKAELSSLLSPFESREIMLDNVSMLRSTLGDYILIYSRQDTYRILTGWNSNGVEDFAHHHDVKLSSFNLFDASDTIVILIEGTKENIDLAAQEIDLLKQFERLFGDMQLTRFPEEDSDSEEVVPSRVESRRKDVSIGRLTRTVSGRKILLDKDVYDGLCGPDRRGQAELSVYHEVETVALSMGRDKILFKISGNSDSVEAMGKDIELLAQYKQQFGSVNTILESEEGSNPSDTAESEVSHGNTQGPASSGDSKRLMILDDVEMQPLKEQDTTKTIMFDMETYRRLAGPGLIGQAKLAMHHGVQTQAIRKGDKVFLRIRGLYFSISIIDSDSSDSAEAEFDADEVRISSRRLVKKNEDGCTWIHY